MVAKALIIAAVVATSVSVASRFAQSEFEVAGIEIEQQQLQDQKDLAAIEGLQAENKERKDLAIALATQAAQAAGQGLGLESGSFQAIQRDTRFQTTQNIRNIKLLGSAKAKSFQLGIGQKEIEKEASKSGAVFGAVSDVVGLGGTLAKAGVGSSGGGGK